MRTQSGRRQAFVGMPFAVLLAALAAVVSPARAEPPEEKPAPRPIPSLAGYHTSEQLTPVASGPGLVICEPVRQNVDDVTAAFGSGCTRWLQFMAAGQPELGRTPLWVTVDHGWRQLGGQRLNLEEAIKLSKLFGLTHVALSRLDTDGNHPSLTVRLYEMPAGQQVGEPLTLQGTPEEIRNGLPAMAAALARMLGVPRPRIPSTVGETTGELQMIGELPWGPGPRIIGERLEPLKKAALDGARPNRALFSGFLYLINRGNCRDAESLLDIAAVLVKALPENSILYGEIGREAQWATGADPKKLPATQLQRLVRAYPANYLLRTAEEYFDRMAGKWREAHLAAEWCVRASHESPDAWMHLSDAIFDEARDFQGDERLADLPAAERDYCVTLYQQRLPVIRHVTELDPDYAKGWHNLSIAAALAGEKQEADEAFWKAVQREPQDSYVLWWGFEMYHSWFPDRAKLLRTARLCAEAADTWTSPQRLRIAVNMVDADLADQATGVVRTDEERDTLAKYAKEAKAARDAEKNPQSDSKK